MSSSEPKYDLNAIRDLLLNGFTAGGLLRLLQFASNPELQEIRGLLSTRAGQQQLVAEVIQHCEDGLLLGDLLAEAQKQTSKKRFELHAPYVFEDGGKPPPPPSPVDASLVKITVLPERVILEHAGQPYQSPMRHDDEELKRLLGQSPEAYGEALFRGMFHGDPMPDGKAKESALAGYRNAQRDSGGRLRFELWPADEALHRHAWECLKDPDSETPLAVYQDTPFYRRLAGRELRPVSGRPLKVLAAICNPTTLGKPDNVYLADMVPINVGDAIRTLRSALGRMVDRGQATLKILESETPYGIQAVTSDELAAELQEGYDVVHILAHGYVARDDVFYLVMEAPDRTHEAIPARKFTAALLGNDLQMAVLASCQGTDFQGQRALQSLGPWLVEQGVPAVIAMQRQVTLPVAELFTERFYDDLGRTGCVDTTLAATRYDVYHRNPASWQWGVPVLLMGSSQGRLLEV